MFNKIRDWFREESSGGHWLFRPVIHIHGGPEQSTRYMTRVFLGPSTPWGRAYLHIFHREDLDRDPHDHPFDFRTIPLNQGYVEEVFDRGNNCFYRIVVPKWRVSFRPAVHTHRVIETERGHWPLITIVWRSSNKRSWGFWCHTREQVEANPSDKSRVWIPWRNYVYGGEHNNISGADELCPGALPVNGWDRFQKEGL